MKTQILSCFIFIFLTFGLLAAQNGSDLQPSETKALLHVNLTDFSGNPKKDEVVIFQSQKNGKSVRKKSDANGKISILLPKGDTYGIKYQMFLSEKQSTSVEIPDQDGIMEATLEVQMENIKNETFELDIHFDPSKASIRSESFAVLDELVSEVKRLKVTKILLSGHTDSDGDAAANLRLSEARAISVKDYLVAKGLSAYAIETQGFGETRPIADNNTDEGKGKNRRTELRILETQ